MGSLCSLRSGHVILGAPVKSMAPSALLSGGPLFRVVSLPFFVPQRGAQLGFPEPWLVGPARGRGGQWGGHLLPTGRKGFSLQTLFRPQLCVKHWETMPKIPRTAQEAPQIQKNCRVQVLLEPGGTHSPVGAGSLARTGWSN